MKGKMKIVVALLVVFVVLFVLVYGASLFQKAPERVCFKQGCFEVQVAREKEELERGLQNRRSLADREGMLFVFPTNGRWDFWMKDTFISLDIIWLDENQNVVYIAHALPPCVENSCPSYGPSEPSRYVLEVKAGVARRLGVNIGDRAEYKKSRR